MGEEFFIIESARGVLICTAEDAEANWAELAAVYKRVRMVRCQVTEVVKEQA